ncbi:MAG: extracellular catalytic domain type 1 short-chain-length polyhydroxyalkanoate depolymerase [Aureispira sp.]
MKYYFLFISCWCSNWLCAQSISGTMQHDGITRNYTLYIPANYSNTQPCPVVLNLHGYGSNASQQAILSRMNLIADTAGFIVAYPEGLLDNGGQRQWNSGYGTGVDDVGYINRLLDTIAATYAVNQQRIYSTGLSNGGIMSNTLACDLNGRIAAIASVAGTMSWFQRGTCTTVAAMPVMHVHGTTDLVVPYTGNAGLLGVNPLVTHWRGRNGLSATSTTTAYPNIVATDGSNAELIVYETGSTVPVHLIKVNNGGHSWPGSGIIVSGTTNMDVDASIEIWRFFQQFSSNYTAQTKQVAVVKGIDQWRVLEQGDQLEWRQSATSIVQIHNALGQLVEQTTVQGAGVQQLRLSNLSQGIYWVSYQPIGQALQSFSFIKS